MESIERYDLDKNGEVSAEEIDKVHRVKKFENNDLRADAQRKMTWIALGGMMVYPIVMILCSYSGLEIASENLTEMAPTFFISTAGVVAAFFGVEAWKIK